MAAARKKPAPKRGASRYQAPARPPVPGWVWMACGLVIGGFVVMLMNLEPGRDEVKRETARPASPAQPSSTSTANAPKPKYDFYTLLPESEVSLPDAAPVPKATIVASEAEAAKVDTARAIAALEGKTPPPPALVAPAPAVPTPSPAPVAPVVPPTPAPAAPVAKPVTASFVLQAGAFRQSADADRVRAQLILLGQNARIEKSGGAEPWHRVVLGPYSSRQQAEQAQKSLADNGFGNLLIQQR